MDKLVIKLPLSALIGALLCGSPGFAQMPSSAAPKAASVAITSDPTVEAAHDDIVILRWTTNNPGGSDEHFGVVQYGQTAGALNETARSHIRLNRGHSDTLWRVRIAGLKPQTTYYYKVTSEGGDGQRDAVTSGVYQFTTAPPGERIMNYKQPQ